MNTSNERAPRDEWGKKQRWSAKTERHARDWRKNFWCSINQMKNTYDELHNRGGTAESFGRDLAIIDEILTERMTTDAGRRLHQWRWRMMCDDKSVMKWVKTIREEVQRSDADAGAAFGPDEKSKKERIKWHDIWCPAEKPSAEAIDEFLGFVPEGGYHVGEWRITADQLR